MTRSLASSYSRRKKWKRKSFFAKNTFKLKEQVMRSLRESFRGRKERKRQFRRLWITRINNSLHSEENKKYQLNYSRFIHLLKANSEVETMNLKSLSEISIHYPEKFSDFLSILANNKSSKN